MSMDDPVFIAVLAGLILAYGLIALRGARRNKNAPPVDLPFEDDARR
jgi:hypothetical protein